MNNKIIFGTLVFFAVFLAGCTLQETSTQPPSTPPQTQPTTQYICQDGRTIVAKLSDCPAVDTEYEECDKASSQEDYYGSSDRDVCFYELAIERDNATLCKKVRSTSSYGDYTTAKCGAEIALSKDDPTVCEDLGLVSKYDCYSELATQTSDPSYCERITSGSKKDDCLGDYLYANSYYITNWSLCDKFSAASSDKSYCYNLAATRTKNTQYCDKIEDSSYGYGTYSKPSCYAGVAKQSKNPSLCSQFSTTTEKDECYYAYATTYPKDLSVCNSITDELKKDDCVYYANYSYYY